jgi:maltose O-acetyltransferase
MRHSGMVNAASVEIGENVFIGSNVTILKGVRIGNNSVIACGSLVTKSIPDNTIAGGVPAKIISNSLR